MGSDCRLSISEREFKVIYLLQRKVGKERKEGDPFIRDKCSWLGSACQARNHPSPPSR